jgi:hypothetical protein
MKKTKVIFRKWDNGDVIALFPEIAVDMIGKYCDSYMQAGQHSAASPDLVRNTKPATKEDYARLYNELTVIGYNLEIIKRFRYSHQQTRKDFYK